jgi:hypothetical protein
MARVTKSLEGVVRCYCGCKYWEASKCIDCGLSITSKVGRELLAKRKLEQRRQFAIESMLREG